MTVRRVYVQKRPGLRHEAEALKVEQAQRLAAARIGKKL